MAENDGRLREIAARLERIETRLNRMDGTAPAPEPDPGPSASLDNLIGAGTRVLDWAMANPILGALAGIALLVLLSHILG
ncbi:hypothetical protein [Rhodospirillum centenum]|uniref:Uncharacterized protein n=1 Tax=Rhodospirillum centenum (strain ATCC 51521 / SW) TaxID=414684 RepID=B6IMX8_RHOCS|nr:hypothetical protein [Rhodospirillum centenum]ACI98875.1 hypothetical protein RC1_1471 [Rhodospirillum centenum SW]